MFFDMKKLKITPEEIEIIKKAQAGDKLAFNKLFYKYKSFVDNILYGYIKDKDEAKDITNIVFLKVFDKLSTFTNYSSFGGWLRTIANRTAIDYLRKTALKKLTFESEDKKLQLTESLSSNETDLINRMTCEQIIRSIGQLPEKNRKINELYYVNNMTIVQISEALQIPTGTIKSVLSRTRNKIKQHFK